MYYIINIIKFPHIIEFHQLLVSNQNPGKSSRLLLIQSVAFAYQVIIFRFTSKVNIWSFCIFDIYCDIASVSFSLLKKFIATVFSIALFNISSLLSLGIFGSLSQIKSICCLLNVLLLDRVPLEFSCMLLQTLLNLLTVTEIRGDFC